MSAAGDRLIEQHASRNLRPTVRNGFVRPSAGVLEDETFIAAWAVVDVAIEDGDASFTTSGTAIHLRCIDGRRITVFEHPERAACIEVAEQLMRHIALARTEATAELLERVDRLEQALLQLGESHARALESAL